MFYKLTSYSKINKILIIALSNIGDMIMIAPAMDVLMRDFPRAEFSLFVGIKGMNLFEGNPHLKKIFFYDKKMPLENKISWFADLRKESYDLVVDFRNSMIPYFLKTRFRTPPEISYPHDVHLTIKHLARLKSIYDFSDPHAPRRAIHISDKDKAYVQTIMRKHLKPNDKFIVIAPLAADLNKTWLAPYFSIVSDEIVRRFGLKVFMAGGANDMATITNICDMAQESIINLAGQTTLVELGELVRHARLTIAHDSGIMHLASYYETPVLALFGPTEPRQSHPWSRGSAFIQKREGCEVCVERRLKKFHICMNNIKPQYVIEAVGALLHEKHQ